MNAVFIRVDGGIRNEAARASAEMLRGGVAILAREALIARETMPGAKVELPMARVAMMKNLRVLLFHTGALPQASV